MQRSVLELGKTIKFFKVGGKVRGIFRAGQNVSAFECEMSVAYTYYKILKDRQRQYKKRTSYLLPDKKEAAPSPPQKNAKADPSPPAKGAIGHASEDSEAQHDQHKKFHMPNMKKLKGNCKQYCATISYVLVGVLTILVALGVIVVTGIASVATKLYDAEQSSRLVAMIVLAVTAAIALSMVIYGSIGALRKKASKSVHATGVVLVILAIIQALIIGLAIKITAKDELSIGKSLADSFKLAKEDSPRHLKLWTETQSDLQCCGVYSPEDYREAHMPYFFPPNIPISCCPNFDKTKPPHNQERQREVCKVNGSYFDNGCRGLIIQVFKETSVVVIGVMIVLIVLEVLLTLLGAYLTKKKKAKPSPDDDELEHKPNNKTNKK